MLQTGTIMIQKRENANSNANNKLRKLGYIPGTISSKGKASLSVSVKAEELKKGITAYGRNALFDLFSEGEKICTVMIKEIQKHPVREVMLHVDFQEVFSNEEIRADLGIRIKGIELIESKRLLLMRHLDLIPVKGLPQLIPDEISIDISDLEAGQSINIGDISFPDGIIPEIENGQVVVSVTA